MMQIQKQLKIILATIAVVGAQSYTKTDAELHTNYTLTLSYYGAYSRKYQSVSTGNSIIASAKVNINNNGAYSTCVKNTGYPGIHGDLWTCSNPIDKTAGDLYDAKINYDIGQRPNLMVIGSETSNNQLVRSDKWNPEDGMICKRQQDRLESCLE